VYIAQSLSLQFEPIQQHHLTAAGGGIGEGQIERLRPSRWLQRGGAGDPLSQPPVLPSESEPITGPVLLPVLKLMVPP
jgi:hypothetical protein